MTLQEAAAQADALAQAGSERELAGFARERSREAGTSITSKREAF